jgi:hypothetical protein
MEESQEATARDATSDRPTRAGGGNTPLASTWSDVVVLFYSRKENKKATMHA